MIEFFQLFISKSQPVVGLLKFSINRFKFFFVRRKYFIMFFKFSKKMSLSSLICIVDKRDPSQCHDR